MAINFPDGFTDTEPTLLLGIKEGPTNLPSKAAVGATGRASMAAATEAQGRAAIGVESTLLSGAADPTGTDGLDGDFWLRTDTNVLFGPKAAGAWPTPGTSLVGPAGADGSDGAPGANGTDGKTILNSTVDPVAGDGVDGDFFLNTTSYEFFGPKAGGSWPANGIVLSHLDKVQTFTKAQRGAVVTLAYAATIAIDMNGANNFVVTLGGNGTLGAPSNLGAGQSGIIEVRQDATGSRVLSYNAAWRFAAGVAPVLTTTASAVDLLAYYVDASGNPVIGMAEADYKQA